MIAVNKNKSHKKCQHYAFKIQLHVVNNFFSNITQATYFNLNTINISITLIKNMNIENTATLRVPMMTIIKTVMMTKTLLIMLSMTVEINMMMVVVACWGL